MQEIALNVPFEASEIMQIAAEELQARMRTLSPLQGGKEYAGFTLDYQVKIKLRRAGETTEKETLAWGTVAKGNMQAVAAPAEVDGCPYDPFSTFGVFQGEPALVGETLTGEVDSQFKSDEPNVERVNRDMPLTVETGDGRGGKIRKKVKVKQPKAEKVSEKGANG